MLAAYLPSFGNRIGNDLVAKSLVLLTTIKSFKTPIYSSEIYIE